MFEVLGEKREKIERKQQACRCSLRFQQKANGRLPHSNKSGATDYLRSQADLNRSRTLRGLGDKARAIAWSVCLLAVFCLVRGDGPSIAVYGKILKDAYSLDGHMEKLWKSWVPAKTLIHAYRDTGDGLT